LVAILTLSAVTRNHALHAVRHAHSTLNPKVVIVAFHGHASFIIWVQNSMIGGIASETVTVVIASLAIIGTVWAKVLLVAIPSNFWKTLIKTAVVSTEVEGIDAGETVSQV